MIAAVSPELQNIGWALAAIGVTLVTLSMVMGIRKKRRKMSGRVTARENLERYKAKAEVRDDLERVMVEVEEMARRVSAQLDAKTVAIEKLLRDAEAKVEQLNATLERFERAAAATTIGEGKDDGADDPPATDDPVAPATPAPPGAASPQDELSRRVYALADEGHAAPAIAKQLDEHIGKVELILALRSA
ncbi:MAG: hypothetical protein GVY24_01160 [Planctomycetes bacterium]|jgi:isoleucyl-tRNA synthetase|nr:hypothetical protein [Planctomycetota bacterium]